MDGMLKLNLRRMQTHDLRLAQLAAALTIGQIKFVAHNRQPRCHACTRIWCVRHSAAWLPRSRYRPPPAPPPENQFALPSQRGLNRDFLGAPAPVISVQHNEIAQRWFTMDLQQITLVDSAFCKLRLQTRATEYLRAKTTSPVVLASNRCAQPQLLRSINLRQKNTRAYSDGTCHRHAQAVEPACR